MGKKETTFREIHFMVYKKIILVNCGMGEKGLTF